MKRSLVFPLFILTILSFIHNHAYSIDWEKMKEHGSYWIKNFGVVTAKDNPFVTRAENIFQRVSMASDKSGKRNPRLLVINGDDALWARVIKDGTIILTYGAVKMCYDGVSVEEGDSRLAFVLGHELAHLAKDEFWHAFALEAVDEHLEDQDMKKALTSQLKETGNIHRGPSDSGSFAKTRELQADTYGLLSMAIAGYDPDFIVNNTTNFIEEWVMQTGRNSDPEEGSHPDPKMRAELLKAHLAAVAEETDYFTFGVNLCLLGRYDDAVLLFDAFAEQFPGREVFNNMGLCHYQIAMKYLSFCDEDLLVRFRLSTYLDIKTHAMKFKGEGGNDCLEDERFLQHIRDAIKYFELAIEKDPSYLPSRINLSSALIMTGEYSKAISEGVETLQIAPDNPDALNNKAVSLYLFGNANNIDTTDNAIELLKSISSAHPDYSNAVYNIAAIQSERGRSASAKATWKAFLDIEPTGDYANAARENLGIEKNKAAVASTINNPASPVKLGDLEDNTKAILQKMKKREFVIGDFIGEFYNGNGMKVLVIDYVVELVETQHAEPLKINDFENKYGAPKKVKNHSCGKTLIYDNFAVDVVDEMIQKWIYF